MKLSVIVPTYRRPQDLARCLAALATQTRSPDEVLVVIRDTDTETWTFCSTDVLDRLSGRSVCVTVPGVVAAMNAGLAASQGDIIAYTDDDAVPHSDWLARIEAHFLANPQVAGVGGRDWVYHGTQLLAGECADVGRVQWFGRVIGNHCYGIGGPRDVDVLKGVNMSFRRRAIGHLRFDTRMRGTGAQVHFELGFTLALRRSGWRLIYDPEIAVDHYPAQRFDEDQRYTFNHPAMINAVHNETLALLEYLPAYQRIIFLLWAIVVGTRAAPGLVQGLRFLSHEGVLIGKKIIASFQGRWHGWRTWKASHSLSTG